MVHARELRHLGLYHLPRHRKRESGRKVLESGGLQREDVVRGVEESQGSKERFANRCDIEYDGDCRERGTLPAEGIALVSREEVERYMIAVIAQSAAWVTFATYAIEAVFT